MKRNLAIVFTLAITCFLLSEGYSALPVNNPGSHSSDTLNKAPDGVYYGISRAKYIYEPYWGIVKFKIKNGRLDDIRFSIRDSAKHVNFDGKYEKYFEGNPEYIQQSRNDWKGVQRYPADLKRVQNIEKLDAVSGATWSYNIFKASVNDALKKSGQSDK